MEISSDVRQMTTPMRTEGSASLSLHLLSLSFFLQGATPFQWAAPLYINTVLCSSSKEFYQSRKHPRRRPSHQPTFPINHTQAFQPIKTYPKINLPKLHGERNSFRNPPHNSKDDSYPSGMLHAFTLLGAGPMGTGSIHQPTCS